MRYRKPIAGARTLAGCAIELSRERLHATLRGQRSMLTVPGIIERFDAYWTSVDADLGAAVSGQGGPGQSQPGQSRPAALSAM